MYIKAAPVLALAISSCHAFKPSTRSRPFHFALHSGSDINDSVAEVATDVLVEEPKAPEKKAAVKKPKKGPNHKSGIFSPLVYSAKDIMGVSELNQLRAKVISMHSGVIKDFVETSDSDFGMTVLETMFELADKDKNGTIDKEELRGMLKSLGFSWMEDKQIDGILKRTDKDGNGVIDKEEWIDGFPKTLKTNLVKLAKANGNEMGFLV